MLKNKTAFITGGTKGIGRGIAEALLKQGINVTITGRTQSTLDDAVKELNANQDSSAKAMGVQANVKEYQDLEKAVKKTVDNFKKIDIVIANAGVGHFAPIDELSVELWKDTIETNLSGVFYTLKASLDQLEQNEGYFMSIGSLAGTNFFEGGSAYNASKFGVTGFTQAAMLDMRKKGIKTTLIMPGSVATYFNENTPGEKDAWKIQKEDIGQIVVDLLKMESRTLPSKVEVRPSFPHKK
ncbi:MAG TPA: SDR family oxidoreductase [Flavobacteriaceae bacterium]|nr:SDR family oxidoreductase [Flavobacteriaceae bacterium]